MIQEVSVESTQETPASSTLEPADAPEVRGRSPQPEPLEPVPEEPQESQEPEEPAEPPPPPVPKARVPPRVKPKAKPKAESTPASAPKAKPKAKRAPKKPEPAEDPEPVDRFQAFSNTDLIAEILARTEDRRMEQKRQLYRSFLQ